MGKRQRCDICAYLVAVTRLMEESSVLGAAAQCPSCQRQLLIPMSPAGVGQEAFEKALYTVASYLEVPDRVRRFRFTLNGQEIFTGGPGRSVVDVKFECRERDFAKLRDLK